MCFLTHTDWETENFATTNIYGSNSCYDVVELVSTSFVFIIELLKDNPIDDNEESCEDWSMYFSTNIDMVVADIGDSRILNHRLTLLIPRFISNADECEIGRIQQIYKIAKDGGEKSYIFICRNGKKYFLGRTIELNEKKQLIYDCDAHLRCSKNQSGS